jgi:MazG family protein
MSPSTRPDPRMNEILGIMVALRTPGTGCPWDLAQNFRTIAPYTIEEAYEVAEAIEAGDLPALRSELGDLLFQVVYHARMAEEQGAFTFDDVVAAITDKMVRRHPHVFGTEAERAAGAAPGFWERAKAEERGRTQRDVDANTRSVLDGVPAALPGFTRAVKLQNKAARVGFDWPSLSPVMEKLQEELKELEEAVAGTEPDDRDNIEEEFGDLLFVVANVARHLHLDPEAALRRANQKFIRRFHAIERKLAEQGRTPLQSDLSEMDRLWDEAKREEKDA